MVDIGRISIPITAILILINVIFFFVEPKTAAFNLDISHPFNQMLQFTPALAAEMPWTFITSTFMHADLQHLFFNMFGLFIFGMFLESKVKARTFLLIFFLAGIIGNVGYMLTASSSFIPGVGASGAIYGLLGVLGAIVPRASMYIMLLPIPVPMFIAVIIYAAIEFLGFFTPSNIARGAHLGGLFFGVAYGLWMRYEYKKKEERRIIPKVGYVYENW